MTDETRKRLGAFLRRSYPSLVLVRVTEVTVPHKGPALRVLFVGGRSVLVLLSQL